MYFRIKNIHAYPVSFFMFPVAAVIPLTYGVS